MIWLEKGDWNDSLDEKGEPMKMDKPKEKQKQNSALKKKAVCSSETSVSAYQSTRRHNPKEQHRHE
jgi:hypothetical protein